MIEYYRKNVYGNELIYLIDSEHARLILELINARTISKQDIRRFEGLGITFTEVLQPSI